VLERSGILLYTVEMKKGHPRQQAPHRGDHDSRMLNALLEHAGEAKARANGLVRGRLPKLTKAYLERYPDDRVIRGRLPEFWGRQAVLDFIRSEDKRLGSVAFELSRDSGISLREAAERVAVAGIRYWCESDPSWWESHGRHRAEIIRELLRDAIERAARRHGQEAGGDAHPPGTPAEA
jgi:hypothetical protein